MNELQKLYDVLVRDGYFTKSFEEFQTKWQDPSYKQKVYDIASRDGLYTKSQDEFINKYSGGSIQTEPVKKKESTVSASKSGKPTSVSSSKKVKRDYDGQVLPGQQKFDASKYQKVGDKYYDGQGEIFTNYPGKEGKAYRYNNGQWFEYSSTKSIDNPYAPSVDQLKQQIKDPMRIAALNKQYGKQAGTEKGVYVGYPGKEQNEYKVENGQWKKRTPDNKTWITVTNEGSINALNNQFKQKAETIKDPQKISSIKQDNEYSLAFNRNLKSINSSLIDKETTPVMLSLSKMFPVENGWRFDSEGPSDKVRITAPNGQKETFVLDNWTWDEDNKQAAEMRGWMQQNNLTPSEYKRQKEVKTKLAEERRFTGPTSLGDREAMEAQKVMMDKNLADALNISKPLDTEQQRLLKKVETAKAEAVPARLEFLTEKSRKAAEIQNKYQQYLLDPTGLTESQKREAQMAIGALADDKSVIYQSNKFVDDIKNNAESYKNKYRNSEYQIGELNNSLVNGDITQDEYKAKVDVITKELSSQESEIKNQIKLSDKIASQSNQAVGENAIIREAQGSFGGAFTLGLIKGAASPIRLLSGAMGEGMTASEWHDAVREAVSPFWNYDTSLEYIRSEERPDLYKAAFSVSESLGTAAVGGAFGLSTAFGTGLLARGAAGALTFFPMSFYEMKDELAGVDMPESHKIAISSIYGVVSGALESLGMEYAMGKLNPTIGAALKRNILKNVLSKSIPKNAPKEFFDALIRTETKAYLGSLGLGTIGAGAVEGVTEGLQSLTGAGIKEIYDQVGDKTELFSNEGIGQIVKGALYETYLGALGGGMVHSTYIASDAIRRKAALNSKELEMLLLAAKSNGMSETLMTNLKADMLNGRMTRQEAKEISQNFDMVRGNVAQMPDNLTPEAQSVSLGLMMERDRLNQQIEGKDPNLVKPQSERVAEINNRLQEIAKENAVQEQSTGEVPVQPSPGVSTEVEERVPGTETEVVTGETITEETEGQQAETEVAQEERQSLIDAYVQQQTELINNYDEEYFSTEEKQKLIDILVSDPVAFAEQEKRTDGEFGFTDTNAQKFLASLEEQDAREALPVAQPTERIEFTQDNLPVELQNVEPVDTKTTRRGMSIPRRILGTVGIGKGETVLTYTGQQLIDAGLRKAPKAVQPVAETATTVTEETQQPITQDEIETRRKETEAKIKRKDLFDGVGEFSSKLGNSNKAAVPFSHRENNGIELVEFAHPDTGSVDVIITGTSENDFVGFYRIYENGKPTNRWSSKFENQSRNKENFKNMIGGVQELLPAGHEYTEKTSISTDGLRVWNQQLNRGYELQYDENGNVVTNEVAINGDAIVNELGIPVNKGKFQNINVTSQAEFQKVKEALLPYLEKLGLNESNVRWMSGPLKNSGTVKIDLPVLKKSQTTTQKEKGKPKAVQPVAETATTVTPQVTPQAAPIAIEPKLESQLTKLYDKQQSGKPLTPKQQQFVESNQQAYDQVVSSKTLNDQAAALQLMISGKTQGPAFQLQEEDKAGKEKSQERKDRLADTAFEGMERIQPEIADEAYDTQEPTKGTVKADINENEPLTEGVPRRSIRSYIGKKVNLLMADLLKVDLNNKTQKMGGAFFPLIPGLRGKVAWASIDIAAAKAIIRGAIKSQISMVYNMNPEAMMSNKVFLESVLDRISNLPDANIVFNQMMDRIQKLSYQKNTEKIHEVAKKSKTMAEFKQNFADLNVDQKAAIMKSILPEQGTDYSGSKIKVFRTLSNDGITKQSMLAENVEQFAADLPAGALTMALNIVDENGNRPTEDTIDNFIITRKQAIEMGLPIHDNYPIYIKGNVDAILTETAPFWDVIKDFKRSLDAKIANLIQKKDTYIVETEVTDKKGDKNKVDVAVKVYNNPNGTRTIEVFNSTEIKGEGKKTSIDALEKEDTDAFIKKNIGKIKSYDEGGLYTAKEARSSTMRSASMKADSAFEITEPTKSKYQQFVERLAKAFPSVEVVTSQEEFNAMIDEIRENKVGNKVLLTKSQNVYGAVYNGKLYLNPNLENYNTPIHEFGHIWLNVAKTMRADLYNKGLELVRNSEYLEQIKNSPEYSRIVKVMQAQGFSEQEIETYLEEEALATAIGDKGESFVSAATKRSFNNWLNNVFDFVKKMTGISDVTAAELQDMTLDDFVQGVVVDLMSENQQFKDAEIESFGSQLQLMTGPAGLSMQDIISMGRAYGFIDAAIKQTLMSQGFKVKDIDAAMQVQVNLVDTMPTAFANVAGGLNEGLTMFNEIQQELEDFRRGTTTTTRAPRMTAKERAARVAELRQQNPTLTELSDSELLKRFPRPAQAATTTTTRPTVGEVRAKALELLQAHPTFQAQTETVQMELMSAYDKTLKTRANNIIQRQISAIRNNLRQRKIGAKELQDAKAFLRNFIKTALPKSEIYSEKDINKMLQILAKSTEATIMRDTDNILAIVEQQREKMKTNVIKDMFAMIANKAKVGKTTGGKRRAAGLDAEGQAFFEAASAILKAVIKGNQTFLDAVKQELDAAENDGRMLSAIMKSVNNEKLTAKERDLLNKAHAYDTFINVKDMQLEEVQNLFAVMKGRRSQSIMDLASKRMQRAAEYEALNAEASAQMRELNPVLFTEITDENGDVQVVPKNTAQLNKDKKEIYDFIRKGKIGKAIRAAKKNWNFNTMGSVRKFFANIFYHLGTMMNMFDNKAKGMTFFVDNVYRPLNRMDENSKLGYFQQMQVLNGIANSIQGITKGFKQLRDSLQTNEVYRIEMKRGDSQTGEFKNMFNKEQLMRMYALSKNATQRNILERQGLTDAKIDEIKNIIGPQAVEFVDKTVDYLSNEYYESVNDVYSAVNDVHLGRIENYFPTQRVDPNAPIDFNPDDPNFSGIFNAETAPSLYERTNSKADIDVDLDFFDVLDKHMQNMERYKAHAEGVKKINAIFQNKNVIAVLDASRTKALIKNLINYAITPNFGMSQQQTILGKIQNKFTGFALAFKVVQIIKQATSFVQAFEDYSYFSKNQNQSKAVRIAKLPIDLIGFMIDSAYVIATMPKQVKQAYGMSANLRDRISKGIEGDVYGLESGARFFKPVDKNSSAWGKTRRALKTGAAAPTMIGDVLGVMGYMVNYRRNIKNGMSQEDALEAFNDYNATQQTRRATERSSIQNNKYELVRAFTMFGSTAFLQMNKVAQAWKNMMDSLKTKGNRMPAAKDIRALILNLGVANAMFALASNLAKYALGDDDDKEEVKKKILEAAAGMNLIMSVPFFNEAFQNAKNYVEGTKDPTRLGTNPLMGVWWKTQKALKADDYTKAVIPLIELTLGAQLDPAIGLYNGFTEGFDDEAIYQTLGISKSYRPSAEDSDDEEDSDEGMMSKTDMKRYNPEMYERLYGKDGSMTEYEELLRKQRKVQAEARRREKDALYGFDENANPDKDDEFGGQNTFGEGFGSGSKFGSGSTFGGGQ